VNTLAVGIEGTTVSAVREMTDKELEFEGWERHRFHQALAIELSNGVTIYPSRDEEGNGYGALFGQTVGGLGFAVTADQEKG